MTEIPLLIPNVCLIRSKSLRKPKIQRYYRIHSWWKASRLKSDYACFRKWTSCQLQTRFVISPLSIIPRPKVIVILKKIDFPYLFPCSPRICFEVIIPSLKMSWYCGFHFIFRLIIGMMNNSSFHAASSRVRWLHTFNPKVLWVFLPQIIEYVLWKNAKKRFLLSVSLSVSLPSSPRHHTRVLSWSW